MDKGLCLLYLKAMSSIRLTQTVKKGGCAAKVSAHELRELLKLVDFPPASSELLVDSHSFDDAAVFRISSEVALVQTLDFFTPIVDDPRSFGRIAAANALSDVYAMGGEPLTAMGILAYPLAELPREVVSQVLQGACDILKEAGVPLVGGHSIDDESLKFGLSVTGRIHPEKIWTNAGAKDGDRLILLKALGTGTLTAGLKRDRFSEKDIEPAVKSMEKLNRVLDLLSSQQQKAIHGATDITGFGLAGHSYQMAQASQVSLVFEHSRIPWLPLSREGLRDGFLTKAHRTNQEYTRENFKFIDLEKPEEERLIYFDPQTSGGLLLSVEATAAEAILESLQKRFPEAQIVGFVRDLGDFFVEVQS